LKKEIRAYQRTNNLCFYCGNANYQIQNYLVKQQNNNRWKNKNPNLQERRQQIAPQRSWYPQPQLPQYRHNHQHLRQIENRANIPNMTNMETPVTSYTPSIGTNQENA
jgi:hypothetical protein